MKIKFADGTATLTVDDVDEALDYLRQTYPDLEVHDDGERILVWADEAAVAELL